MKKLFLLFLIFFSVKSFCQENKFERPNYFIGITPFKPWISSGIGLTFHQKQTETLYVGIESIIYTPIEGAMYQASNGIKLYGNLRTYFSEKRSSSFYAQGNLGGGYFSQTVTYVTAYYEPLMKENYPIDKHKQFIALGGNAQLGYHLILKRISFDFNMGFQILMRILDEEIE